MARPMDPRYPRAVKSTENVFTPRELQMMDITPENMMKAKCTPYFEDNYKDKNKLRNTFIKGTDSGLYEFFAKEVECSAKFRSGKDRLKQALKKAINEKHSTESKKAINKKQTEYENEMNVLFRKMSKICQHKAKGLCDIRDKSDDQYTKEALKELLLNETGGDQKSNEDEIKANVENMDQDELKEKIKRNNPRFKKLLELSDEELGMGRKMLLMINGFVRKGKSWKYDPEIEKRFIKAASICRNNNLCVKTEFSDIPKEISSFSEAILDGISTPYYYLSDKGTKMLEISKQKGIERHESSMAASDAKIEKLEAEQKALDEKKKLATAIGENKNASATDKAQAAKDLEAIKKRESRINEGTRAKKSVSALKLNKTSSQYKMDKLKLQKESLTQKLVTPKKPLLSRLAKKSVRQRSEETARKQAFKDLKGTKRNEQLGILNAKSNKEGVALSRSQAQTRARLQYNIKNPGMGISKERYRGIQREKAKQGQADLTKYKQMKPTNLSKSQQARMKVLEDGVSRMGFGTSSVKSLKIKTETRNEKTNRLSKEREKLIEKAQNTQQKFSKNNTKRLSRLQDGNLFKNSVLKRQGISKNNRILERMKTKKNIMGTGEQPMTKKDINKLDKNIKRLQTKKNNRNTKLNTKLKNNKTNRNKLLEESKTRELSKSEKAQLSKLQYGTRRLGVGEKSIASREGKNKTVRNKEAVNARLEALQAKQLSGVPLSNSNKVQLYGKERSRFNPRRSKKSLYKKSGMNINATKKAQFNQLNKIKRKGDFTEKGSWIKKSDQKRYRQLQTNILKRNGIKSPLNRTLRRKEQEAEALEAQSLPGNMGPGIMGPGIMGPESSTRQKELNIQLNGLRETQADRTMKTIKKKALTDLKERKEREEREAR